MTLCSYCNEEYLAHDYGDLVKCNRKKDLLILNYKLDILSNIKDDKRHIKGSPHN